MMQDTTVPTMVLGLLTAPTVQISLSLALLVMALRKIRGEPLPSLKNTLNFKLNF